MARIYKKHSQNKLDLSSNEVYSSYMLSNIKNILLETRFLDLVRYPEEENLVDTFSELYKVPKYSIELGHGSDDILNRIFSILKGKNIYIKNKEYQGALYYSSFYCNKTSYEDCSAIYLSSINNYGEPIDEFLLNKAIGDNKFIILDEAYSAYGKTYIGLLEEYDKIVITKSMSKELGLAGFRSGLSISNAKFTNQLKKIASSYTSNSLSTLVIPQIIKKGLHKEHIKKVKEGLKFLRDKLDCEYNLGPFVILDKNKIPKKIKDKISYKDLGDKVRITATSIDYLIELGI